ncbi:MAG: biopolymer transporter ExbD [Candidatus Delongbacteria bacterium]|nr:biopolymer transporter ExbD [Candidatus Delongbacteria bacterium]
MPFKNKEAPRKTEMTSMIDMIFLLLIFFLVTLSVSQKGGGIDSMKGVPRPVTIEEGEMNEVDKVVQIDDRLGVNNIRYCVVTSQNYGTKIPSVSLAQVYESIEPGDAISIRASDSVSLKSVIEVWDLVKNQRKAFPVLNRDTDSMVIIEKGCTERP